MTLLPYALPSEAPVSALLVKFPCREAQVRSLATLLSPPLSSPRNLVLHGSEATGKSSVVSAVLAAMAQSHDAVGTDTVLGSETLLRYAIVKSSQCITGRHLLEATVAAVAAAVGWNGALGRCENLAQLAVEIFRLLEDPRKHLGNVGSRQSDRKFVLVFDGIDRQRDAPPTLLPALARLSEIASNLTVVFIVTHPRPHFLHVSNVPYLNFPAYSKVEAIRVLSLNPPPLFPSGPDNPTLPSEPTSTSQKASSDIYPRFVAVVWDSLAKHSGRDVLSLRATCLRLWPQFTATIRDGTHTTKDFSRLLVSKRYLFQNERILVPSIIAIAPCKTISSEISNINPSLSNRQQNQSKSSIASGLSNQLPLISRLLLIASYLCSHTPTRFDTHLFSRTSTLRKKKRGGGTALSRSTPGRSKHRKISRKLLGPQAFVLERMMAVFWAISGESDIWRRIGFSGGGGGGGRSGMRGDLLAGSADVQMAVATLASLRLVVRTSGSADVLDASTKLKVNVGWEVVRGIGRSVGVEVEDWLID